MQRLALIFLASTLVFVGCSKSKTASQGAAEIPSAALSTPLPNGLIVEDLQAGSGEAATSGKRLVIHFEGYLENGSRFSSSKVANDPLDFKLGDGKMIRGLEEGLKGMRVGGKRKLVIPSELAFKDHGLYGLVPPNEKVHYVVELLSVR